MRIKNSYFSLKTVYLKSISVLTSNRILIDITHKTRALWGPRQLLFLNKFFSPGWCGSVDWALACEPKGHRFSSQSGHMPGLQARSPVGMQDATTHWFFSPSLSPSLSLKRQKAFKKIYLLFRQKREGERQGEKPWCERNIDGLPLAHQGPGHNPGMCPGQEPNRWPFSLQENTQTTEPHQSGHPQ